MCARKKPARKAGAKRPASAAQAARKRGRQVAVRRTSAAVDAGVTAPRERRRDRAPAWGVLVYLAGDTPWGQEALHHDLLEILRTGASARLSIVVQHDGPDGASRYVLPADGSRPAGPVQRFERLDSGSTRALLDFLRWGMSVCQTERLALVVGSPYAVAPGKAGAGGSEAVLTLTYDQGSGNLLNVSDLAVVLRQALSDADRERIDLLAIDSCYVQFLELAYELEGVARVLIAPQTPIPESGWDYRQLLGRWKSLAEANRPVSLHELAIELVAAVADCYRAAGAAPTTSVSALDLQRLDDVANAFDTLCISTMQVLGESLIWHARGLLLHELQATTAASVYDCGSFFAIWGETLDAFADEAYQRWLASTLNKVDVARIDRFVEAVARALEQAPGRGTRARETQPPAVLERLSAIASLLRAVEPGRRGQGEPLMALLTAGHQRRVESLQEASGEARDAMARAAQARDAIVQAAIVKASRLLPEERQNDLRREQETVENARRLARQAEQARRAVLGDRSGRSTGLVLGTASVGPPPQGWPRWSGVSMYRPNRLDELMNDSYQQFAFHRRVHWAALLGAANLIEQHARALWRLVSSLLATGSAGTRRDVLRRLSGPDSVVWGLRDQFQVMAPAPTLTLSLEQRNTGGDTADGRLDERYLLRLESTTRGAVVTEQDSRVQPAVMKRALHELNELLQRDRVTGRSLTDLRAIGGLLGEDIFQALGRTLDDERLAVREETPGATPHLQLQIPVELMGYPWELLHRRGVWLGEQFALGRQVFMPTGLARRVPARRQGCVRPLVIGDPIFDPDVEYRQLAGARREAEQVAGWFERASAEVGSIIDFDRERDTRIGTRITSAELRALLRDGRPGEDGHYYDIVHFAGHGIFREEDRETSAWLLSDGELWALEIRNTLQDHPAPPWLVYANACEAGMDGGRPARVFQGNVFGLATAFINQGVAAYVGPLWPIDDLLAQHIALQFYQQLLAERSTLGEALRRAKISARAVAYAGATGQADAAWPGLGWASLVMYGDPTEELFQALAGGSRPSTPIALGSRAARPASAIPGHADEAFGAGQPSVSINTPAVASLLHAPDHVVAAWVRGPGWIPAAPDTRGAEPEGLTLELIEDAGLRRWRVKRPGSGARGAQRTSDHLPGSSVAALLEDDRIREQLPSTRSIPRIIGSWVLSGLAGGARGLVRRYDEEQVRQEGLLFAAGVTGRELMTAEHQGPLAPKEGSQGQRVLLIMHGTFSNSAYLTDGLGPGFMAWARQRYGAVMALDHWTLSKTPEQNAALLADELRAFDAGLLDGRRIDIIAHSRGGLVARAFCELLGHAAAVRTLIFIGTPNCGTDLATPRHWGTFADLLVNMTGVDGAEFFGRAAGLLAQLAVAGLVNDVPGLLAQSPESLSQPGSFLNRLQDPGRDRGGVRYSVICSEFEPNVLIPNLRRLSKAAAAAGLDAAADALFATANDLVVNTAYAWGIGTGPSGLDILPPSVGDRVLLFMPPTTALTAPPGAAVEIGLNVHHCNVFNQPRALLAIQSWLDG